MKNFLTMIFLIVSLAVGFCLFAGVYFGVLFGALDWLNGTMVAAEALGARVSVPAFAIGIPVGVGLGLSIGMSRLSGETPADWFTAGVGIILAAGLVILPLYGSGLAALDILAGYKALGLFSVAGLIAAANWINKTMTDDA